MGDISGLSGKGKPRQQLPLRTLRFISESLREQDIFTAVTEAQRRSTFVTMGEQGLAHTAVTAAGPTSPLSFAVPSSWGQECSLNGLGG